MLVSRIDRFIDPGLATAGQVDRAMEAFANGGLWGRGPGEGTVKSYLPDAHADCWQSPARNSALFFVF